MRPSAATAPDPRADPFVQPLQARPRIDAQLLHEEFPCLGVRLQSGRLPTGPVERRHQHLAEPLVERVRADQRGGFGRGLGVAAEVEFDGEPGLQRGQPESLQAFTLGACPCAPDPGQGGTAPQREPGPQMYGGVAEVAGLPGQFGTGDGFTERGEIEVLRERA